MRRYRTCLLAVLCLSAAGMDGGDPFSGMPSANPARDLAETSRAIRHARTYIDALPERDRNTLTLKRIEPADATHRLIEGKMSQMGNKVADSVRRNGSVIVIFFASSPGMKGGDHILYCDRKTGEVVDSFVTR